MKHLLALLAFLSLTGSLAYAQVDTQAMGGSWNARGQIASTPTAELERGRCRITIATSGGNSMTISGRCAVAAGAAQVQLRVTNNGGQLTGSASSSLFEGAIALSGTRQGDTISMAAQSGSTFEGVLYWSRVEIGLQSESRFTMREWTAPAGTSNWRLTRDLTFERQ